MSTQTTTKKRKSADGATTTTKKVKITKSADRPSPTKSALKKTKSGKSVDKISNGGSTKPAKDSTISDHEEETGGTSLTPSETAALLAGFSSSDSEPDSDNEEAGVSLSSIPKVPTAGTVQKTTKQDDPESSPGVIYIGRIPHGFYEPQMRAYFSQFGAISHLRLARNPKTGKSRHYAFVEFASQSVAEIVAKTMDKYLLFGHLLQVRQVPREQVNERLWKGGRRKPMPRNKLEGSKLRRGASRDVWEARVEKEMQRRQAKKEKLAEMGYEFEMPAVKGVAEVPLKEKAVEEDVLAGADAEGGVKVLENGEKAAPDADVQREANAGNVVPEEKVSKKRPAHGKAHVKKVVKKVKT